MSKDAYDVIAEKLKQGKEVAVAIGCKAMDYTSKQTAEAKDATMQRLRRKLRLYIYTIFRYWLTREYIMY